MHNEFQSHKGKRQIKIQPFLQGRIIQAKKLNNSFLFHNSRMISLLNNGMLVYYSRCFKWSSKQFDKLKEKPKCGVYFNNVYHSCVKYSENEVELIVKFKKSQIYHFENLNNSYVKEPKSEETLLWIFLISVNDLDGKEKFQSVREMENIHSLYSIKGTIPDEKTLKSISQQVRTEKTIIQQRNIIKDSKNKKQVQWLDLQIEKIINDNNQIHNNGIKSEQLSQDDQWEINEESIDFIVKSMPVKRSSLPCLIPTKKIN
ncbi:unnamed protein product [Paramecium sonneborni]|uniref:Uncharacterized protein n=1 Tax=Paramecium sonneborni TaxID=65129 RepID=A0A8S1LEJ3_9CILI|nr:unnamed protein product [Paramecium sonneborni]